MGSSIRGGAKPMLSGMPLERLSAPVAVVVSGLLVSGSIVAGQTPDSIMTFQGIPWEASADSVRMLLTAKGYVVDSVEVKRGTTLRFKRPSKDGLLVTGWYFVAPEEAVLRPAGMLMVQFFGQHAAARRLFFDLTKEYSLEYGDPNGGTYPSCMRSDIYTCQAIWTHQDGNQLSVDIVDETVNIVAKAPRNAGKK